MSSNAPNWFHDFVGAVAFLIIANASAATAEPIDLKGYIFDQTTLDEWRDAVYEERPGIGGGIEIVAPFCSSGKGKYLDNDMYFSDNHHNPRLGIETCYRYAPGCSSCISSLAQAVTDVNRWIFLDGTLVRMEAILYRTQLLNNLLGPMVAKYGEPGEVRTHTLSNSFGAQYESREWTWQLESLEISVIERAGTVNKSFVSFSAPSLMLDMTRRLESVAPDTSNL